MTKNFLKLVDKLGLDKDEIMQMTVIEALLKIEDAKQMWNKYREEVK